MSNAAGPKPKKPAGGPKVFDIMRPGKAQPSASSRPVILGNQPKIHDSTLTDTPAKPSQKIEDSGSFAGLQDDTSTPAVDVSPAETAVPPAAAAEMTSSQPVAELTSPTVPTVSESEVADGEGEEPAAPTLLPIQPSAPATDVAPADDAVSAPAVDTSQIVVSHHRSPSHKRRTALKSLLLLLGVLVVAALVFDVLLDGGYVKTSHNLPHTHFLKRQTVYTF